MQGINGVEPLSIADNNKMDRQGAIADRKVENRKHRFHLVPFEEIQLGTEPQYLVSGIIPRVGLVVAWGPPKCGKTFWTFDLAMHVALGREYRGRYVEAGAVVYCAFEGQSGIKGRVEAFRQTFPITAGEPVPFYLEPVTLDLIADQAELIATIKRHLDLTKPALVVLDTLNRSLRGNENDSKDMSAYIRAADAIRAAFDCAIIIVHHCGIAGERPRGHTSLTGAVEVQLSVKKSPSDAVIVEVECAKDMEAGLVIASRLKKIELGTDSRGQEISSCVVMPEETPTAATGEPKLSKNIQTMIALLRSAEPNGLTTDEWNSRARAEGLGVKRRADLVDFRLALQGKKLVREYADRWHVAS
jgi:hypothetical protein